MSRKNMAMAHVGDRLLEVALTAGASLLVSIITAKLFMRIIHPRDPALAASHARLCARLGVKPRDFPLNEHERTMASGIYTPDQLAVGLDDVAGLEHVLEPLRSDIVMSNMSRSLPRKRSSLFAGNRGVLLYGPPGTGKTMLAKALARDACYLLLTVQSSSVYSKWLGDSNKLTNAIFTLATRLSALSPVIIFIDEVDALLGEAGSSHDVTTQVKTEFMQLWDMLASMPGVMVVAATNRPNRLNDAIWRRFSHHFEVKLPEAAARELILEKNLASFERELRDLGAPADRIFDTRLTDSLPVTLTPPPDLDIRRVADNCRRSETAVRQVMAQAVAPLARVAELCEGYSGSDLVEVVRRASQRCLTAVTNQACPRGSMQLGSVASSNDANFWGRLMHSHLQPLSEVDLLHGIAEVKAAANTNRGDYANTSRMHRRAPGDHVASGDDAGANGVNGGDTELHIHKVMSQIGPEGLRTLALVMEQM